MVIFRDLILTGKFYCLNFFKKMALIEISSINTIYYTTENPSTFITDLKINPIKRENKRISTNLNFICNNPF